MTIYNVRVREYHSADTWSESDTRIRLNPAPIDAGERKRAIIARTIRKLFGRSCVLLVDWELDGDSAAGYIYKPTRPTSSLVAWGRTDNGRVTVRID